MAIFMVDGLADRASGAADCVRSAPRLTGSLAAAWPTCDPRVAEPSDPNTTRESE
eukprot:CAMPEP_0119483578 /NCGR_PEP_ID=MMETSP1344-20130328/10923_1 /TAXON_ID=236787 /ORGANISM="Florenciella parvula, Strain CCMP2471" /LENGTH=54 /DNA_ID=CAMNT_0007518083 /DNA_START=1207 /DNA_END=1369 /DNA_ORIENTATION=+